MRRNVSQEVMDLEDIISKAYILLSQNKTKEAEELLKKEHDRINKSYE